jgi:hypothetical protein
MPVIIPDLAPEGAAVVAGRRARMLATIFGLPKRPWPRSSNITYMPMGYGFMYLVAAMDW